MRLDASFSRNHLIPRMSTKMTEKAAREVAQELGGEPMQVAHESWHIAIRQGDGRLVVISDVAVWEYPDEQAFREGRADKTIPIGSVSRRWQ